MGINKKLLPIKGHYFLSNAGSAPILPFIPIIAKELGFSSVAVGWASTAAPILTILIKPLLGTFVDKQSCHKSMFLFFIFVHALVIFAFSWAPSLPTENSVELICNDGINLTTCSGKLKDKCYSDRVLQSFNSTCKLNMQRRNNISDLQSNLNHFLKIEEPSEFFEYCGKGISVKLVDGTIKNSCISMKVENPSTNWSSICEYGKTMSAQLFCSEDILKDLIKKSTMDESQEMFTPQFWTLFILIVTMRVLGSVLMSLGDTLCFSLLGDKPENYGMQRMWGAVGWGMFSIIAGIIVDRMSNGKTEKDYTISFYWSLIILHVDLLVATFIKVNPQKKSKSIVKDVKQLFQSAKNIIFLVWCIISGIYVSFIWYYLFWFIEDLASISGCHSSNGWIKTLEGLILTIHCYAGEIPFFFMSGRILHKIGHKNAMTLVLFTFGLRFLVYSMLTDPWWVLPTESLNGITFGLFYATMTTYASKISSPGTEATVQNLVGAVFEGAGTSTGALLGGYLFRALGSSKTFFVLGLSALAFGMLHIILQYIFKHEELVHGQTNHNCEEKSYGKG